MSDQIENQGVEEVHEYHDEGFHSLMEIFDELSFREKWAKVSHGLKEPKESGEHKWAMLQIKRLAAPACAVLVPLLAVALLMTISFLEPDRRVVEVQMIEPEELDELDEEIEELIEEIEPPEPTEVDFADDMAISEVEQDVVAPSQEFSPQPAELDSVALTKSPVILKGILGSRNPGARGSALGRYGGGKGTERAVLLALRWLKKHQRQDGSWDSGCGLGKAGQYPIAMTSMALLTYLAHGETPASAEFGLTVENAIKYMVEKQKPDGHFYGVDGHNYSHPIATYALSEAFALTKVPMVKDAAEKAAVHIIKGQHPSGGWDYNMKQSARDDTSYMAWCAQAMKAAHMAGLEVDGIEKVKRNAIKGFQKNAAPSGGFGYTAPGGGGLTGAGVLCMQLLGAAKKPEAKRGLAYLQEARTYKWEAGGQGAGGGGHGGSPIYYWYYDTQAMFHEGGDTWNRWNKMFSPTLVKNQTVIAKAIADLDGNMVDIGYWQSPSDKEQSRGLVYATTLSALQLTVYYRYLPTFKAPTDLEEEEVAIGDDDDDIDIQIL